MKDNRLLADYLQLELDHEYFYSGDAIIIDSRFQKWEPHFDWNQLMMVVEKIEEEDAWIDVKIDGNICSIERGDSIIVKPIYQWKSKIEAVYNACVEYIKSKG